MKRSKAHLTQWTLRPEEFGRAVWIGGLLFGLIAAVIFGR